MSGGAGRAASRGRGFVVGGAAGGGFIVGGNVALRHNAEQLQLRRLDVLRGRQVLEEHKAKAELSEARQEFAQLKESNTRNIEAAERELVQLTESLQESLRVQHDLQNRARKMRDNVAELSLQSASLEGERDCAIAVHREAAMEFRELDVALSNEKAAKKQLLVALGLQRSATEQVVAEASAASERKAEALAVVEVLRREDEILSRLDDLGDRVHWRHMHRVVREGFLHWAVAASLLRKMRWACARGSKRLLLTVGVSTLQRWRTHCYARAKYRRRWRLQAWTCADRALRVWREKTRDSRWLSRHIIAAASFCRRRILRGSVHLWILGSRAAIVCQMRPARVKTLQAILACWHEEALLSQWTCWVLRSVDRWQRLPMLRRKFRAWKRFVAQEAHRRSAVDAWSLHRTSNEMQVLFDSWRTNRRTRAKLASILETARRAVLLSCWQALQHLVRRRHEITDWKVRIRISYMWSLLARCLRAWRDATARGALLLSVAGQAYRHRGANAVRSQAFLLSWSEAAKLQRSIRHCVMQLVRKTPAHSLAQWRAFAKRAIAVKACTARCVAASARRGVRCRRWHLQLWASKAAVQVSTRMRMMGADHRRSLTLRRDAFCAWTRVFRASRKACYATLQDELAAASAVECELEAAIATARDTHKHMGLRQIVLMDELHGATEQAAAVRTEQQEAQTLAESLERAAAEESSRAWYLRDEGNALLHEVQELTVRHLATRAALETQLQDAVRAPLELRAVLRGWEQEARDASAEEVEAEHVANTLCEELEDMHHTATARLRNREAEVSVWRQEVRQARVREAELEAAVVQARVGGQAQRLSVSGSKVSARLGFGVHAGDGFRVPDLRNAGITGKRVCRWRIPG